jgi:hypothetical protein
MKNKLTFIIIFFVVLSLGKGCSPEHFIINNIDFNAAIVSKKHDRKEFTVYNCTSSIKDKLIFILSYETEYLYGFFGTIGSTCYATTVPKIFDNEIVTSSMSLVIDKPFIYKGRTISSMTNLFNVEDITSEVDNYKNSMVFCGKGADLVFEFSEEFMVNSSFKKNEIYEFIFLCQTTDKKIFRKSVRLKFE